MRKVLLQTVILFATFATNATGQGSVVWSAKNSGLNSSTVSPSTFVKFQDTIFAGVFGDGVYRSYNDGDSWVAFNTGLTDLDVQSLIFKGDTLFAATYGSGIYRSVNYGRSWFQVNSGLSGFSLYVDELFVVGHRLYAGAENDAVGAKDGGVYLSTDNGSTWTIKNTGLSDHEGRRFAKIDTFLFVASIGGGIFRSTNSGDSWTAVNNGQPDGYVQALVVKNNKLFAATVSNGVYMTSDNGANWTARNSGITNVNGRAMTLANGTLYYGSTGGSFYSVDDGASWSSTDAGLTITSFNRLEVLGNYMFAGMNSGGLYRASIIPPPTITSFTPTSGPVGTSVTITGMNFNTTPANNVVYFGGVKASVTNASATSLTVTVPSGATYASITVTDTTTGLGATSGQLFTLTFPGIRGITSSSFATRQDFSTSTNPNEMAIVDVDNDGKLDVVVAGSANEFSVYRNQSSSGVVNSGSLASPVSFSLGTTSQHRINFGDLDGDGRQDIVVTANSYVVVFKNTSTPGVINSGSFASPFYLNKSSNGSGGVCIGDVDGDGRADIVQVTFESDWVSVFRNVYVGGVFSDASFAAPVNFSTADGPTMPILTDLNGDRRPEIIVSCQTDDSVCVFENVSSSGSIDNSSFLDRIHFDPTTAPTRVGYSDIDDDGKVDIVSVGDGSVLSIFQNNSAGSTITSSTLSKIDISNPSTQMGGLAFGDLDGDGKVDMSERNWGGSIYAFRNIHSGGAITSGSFASPQSYTSGTQPGITAIADVDGDGRPELIALNYGGNTMSIFRNQTSDLVAYYPFTGGSTADSSGNGNNGINNGATPTTDRFGNANSAFDFNGSSSTVVVPDDSLLDLTGDFTISLWESLDQFNGSFSSVILSKHPYGVIDGYWLAIHPTGQVDFEADPFFDSTSPRTDSNRVFTNRWHHIVFAYDKSSQLWRFYVDNILVRSGTTAFAISDISNDLVFGDRPGDPVNVHFDGKMDDIQIYSRALGAAEIDSLYHVGEWPLADMTPPSAPTNLTAMAGNQQVALHWNNNTESDFMRYRIYRGTSPNPTTQVDSSSSSNVDTTKVQTGLTNYTQYYFRVTAVDTAGNVSAFSNEIMATPFNSSPVVVNALRDTTFVEDFSRTFVFKLTPFFVDGDGQALAFSALSLDAGVATELSNDSLFLSGLADYNGAANIEVSATDGELSARDTFLVTVSPVNDRPHVKVALRDTTVNEDFGRAGIVFLPDVFEDVDGDQLSFSTAVLAGDAVIAEVTNDSLYIVSISNLFGAVSIRVTASDNLLLISDTLTIDVVAVNDPIMQTRPIRDTILAQDFGGINLVKLGEYFSDVDNQISYSPAVLGSGITASIVNGTDSLRLVSQSGYVGSVNVRIQADDGLSIVSDTFKVTVLPNKPQIGSIITVTPSHPTEGQAVTVSVTISGVVDLAELIYGNSSQNLGFTRTMTASGNTYSYTVPGDSLTGKGLWFRIHAFNMGGEDWRPSQSGKQHVPIRLKPESITQAVQLGAFPDGVEPDGYSTISFPFDTTVALSSIFGSQKFNGKGEPTNWRAQIPTLSGLVDVDSLKAGRACMINFIGKKPKSIALATGLTNNAEAFDSLRLAPGWSLIQWPFAFQATISFPPGTAIADSIWYKTATGWATTTVCKPFGGYAIHNKSTDSITLGRHLNWLRSSKQVVAKRTIDWSIGFAVAADRYRDDHNMVGVASGSAEGLDDADGRDPINIGKGVNISFRTIDGNVLAFDVRDNSAEGHVWDMIVQNNTDAKVMNLTWSPYTLPVGYKAILIDIDNNSIVNLLEQQSYTTPGRQKTSMKVFVGTTAFVTAKTDEIKQALPETFALGQNYPNPFNPNTTLKFDVARSGDVSIAVYNVLGQRVRELTNKYYETGKYSIQWDGKDNLGRSVSSGVYLYRIQTKEYTKTRKMLLLK